MSTRGSTASREPLVDARQAQRAGPAFGFAPAAYPSVDDVDFDELFCLEELTVDTEDGWCLVITRYRPVPQPFPQPLFGVPLLLVHGYTQNRRAWNAGEFVKNMLYFGADVFLLELRGHGKSSVAAQRRRARREAAPLPADLDYGWDLDSHLLYDLPAAVAAVKRASGRERIFYCGHSLGGILGYAYATLFDDLAGLATIGSPSDFARMPLWMRAGAWLPLVGLALLDVSLAAANAGRVAARALARASGVRAARPRFKPWRLRRLPFRLAFQWLEASLRDGADGPAPAGLPLRNPLLYQPRNVALSALRPLLREGANDEPRATAEQFARWIRNGELVCYRLRHDVAAAFPRISIPIAIFFGDEDPFATVATTRNVYRSVSSEYLLWRPVRGSSHLDLTMGYDIRQICYDVKNLISYALDHDGGRTSLPRRRRAAGRAAP
jgi:pimeloyl-ACP methyl ester carboxylesterase